MSVWGELKVAFHSCVFMPFFFFFPLYVNSKITVQGTKNTIHTLFMHYSHIVHGSHDTIHTFKNYFVTVFSVFSFSNNKFYPNGPLVYYIKQRDIFHLFFSLIFMSTLLSKLGQAQPEAVNNLYNLKPNSLSFGPTFIIVEIWE